MTLPGVSILLDGRARAESLMLDTCSITRPKSGTTIDLNTGLPIRTDETIYSGKCKVQDRETMVQPERSGDHTYILSQLYLHVPVVATGIVVGDTVTITGSTTDPAQINRTFRVAGMLRKTFATAQRLLVEEVQA